ncbi:MAG TPA: inorganic phosphate transporter, partial [Pseudomonas pachastrellae]|nr:inorganic phosphate transporter [Halopseudomonas pachastrellae]
MTLIAEYGTILLILACLFGFFMAWGVGANDVANAMGTSVGSRALTIKQAIVVAMVFEFLGAYLAGGSVTQTIRSGIVDAEAISPDQMVLGMLAALLAAGTWLLVASIKGWPVSTTHSIIGAVIGFGAVGVSMDAVHWDGVVPIAASWVISPLLSGIVAFMIFISVHKLILDTDDPFANAKRYVPFYMFAVGFVVTILTLTKGLKHIGLELNGWESLGLALLAGIAVSTLGVGLLSRIKADPEADRSFHFASVEKVFAVLMIFTACAMAFAHGSNDVANAVGPLAAIVG